MKSIRIVFACVLITGFATAVSAQKTETTKEGDIKTTEPSDKYGAGGTHETTSNEKFQVIKEVYYDKCGRKREAFWAGPGVPVRVYFDENGKRTLTVTNGNQYFAPEVGVKRLDPAEGKALVQKLENTPSAPCPEKAEKPNEQPQPKIKPELPGGAFSPSITPPATEHGFAPFSPSTFKWTAGFYAGIEGNYTRGSDDFSLMPTGRWHDFPDLSLELWERGQHEFDRDGGGIGGYAGYNFMLCEHFLFGLEVEGRRMWGLDGRFETGDFDFNRNGMFDIKSRIDTPYLVSFAPRVGYGCGRFLPYVKGGLSFGEVDAHQTILTSNFGGNTNAKESANQVGWCVGSGLEYALTDHWRLRVEYQYTDLGTLDFSGRGNPDSFRSFTSWNSVHVTEHSGTFGLGYSFPSFGR